MSQLGSALLFFGIGSIVLNLIGMEFILLMWVDSWGETVGWIIRITMIVVGAILMAVDAISGSPQTADNGQQPPPGA